MEAKETPIISPPPRLMSAIIAGFNTVTNHIGLILYPIFLDIFIWFGPKLRLQKLLEPVIDKANQTLGTYTGADMKQMLESAQQAWTVLIQRINLTSSLSTFPFGIPSLLAASDGASNPLNMGNDYQISSIALALAVFLFLSIIGIILGTFYINAISRRTHQEVETWSVSTFYHQLVNLFGLVIVLIVAAIIFFIPSLFVVSIVSLFSPAIAQIVFLIITFILLWLLVPLFFSPHGIFYQKLNVLKSITSSIRLVRLFLPGTGLFILVAILLAQGLDILWLAPPISSWLMLIGIFGHAFIYTSLIAASFAYYHQGTEWMQQNLTKLNQILKAQD